MDTDELFGPIWLVAVAVAVAFVLVPAGASELLLFWVLTVSGVVFVAWFLLQRIADNRVAGERTRSREEQEDTEQQSPPGPKPRTGSRRRGGLVPAARPVKVLR